MKRVTAIGGIFFKCKDPESIRKWYDTHLGFNTDAYGTTFQWRKIEKPEEKGYSVWSPFKESTDYFSPSTKDFMVNFRVENLEALLPLLKEEGVQIVGEIQIFEYGKFAHILDPEGNKIELWESNDEEYEKIISVVTP
jgi:predicted enzyme related to lactoylglutathione lyase